jgi:hypothetical protein
VLVAAPMQAYKFAAPASREAIGKFHKHLLYISMGLHVHRPAKYKLPESSYHGLKTLMKIHDHM